MGSLQFVNACARCLSDLANLAASTSDDAPYHVCGDANVLSLDLLAVLVVIGTVACSHDTRAAAIIAPARALVESCSTTSVSAAGRLSANNRVVENSASASLPVVDQTFADFPDSTLDAFRSALNLDYSLGRLRKHLLLSNHANTRSVLNVLDLKTLSSNNGTHLVVRDEKLDSYIPSTRNSVATTSDGQDTVVNALHNLTNTSLDTSLISEIGDILATLANNDTGFLGGNNRTKGELGLSVLLLRLRGRFAVRTEAVIHSKLIHLVEDVTAVAGDGVLRGRHFVERYVGKSGSRGG
ncbi:hypothetical protein HG531_011813 [Fusarium graminearum]|nr:hypothetical protein HG531_011813 [Fusarium graminearum]